MMQQQYATLTGRFLTQGADELNPVPLSGVVECVPRSHARGGGVFYGIAPVVGRVVDGVLMDEDGDTEGLQVLAPQEGLEPDSWSWRVTPRLRDPRRGTVPARPFDVIVSPGQTLDLVSAAPVPEADTGRWVTQGEPGRDALMLVPDPVIRGLFVMVRGAVPVDAAGMIPVGPMLRSER
ncbi:MAG: hypothetical protein L0I17_03215 [Actinomycetia bacterium]|nr:hypothetical protein [Actinomycetes bacterium]